MKATPVSVLLAALDRIKREHEDRLLALSGESLRLFQPARLSTYGESAESFVTALQQEASQYCSTLRSEAVRLLEDPAIPLNEEMKSLMTSALKARLDSSLYLNRLTVQEEAMERQAGRMGVELAGRFSIGNLTRARVAAGTNTWISRTLSAFDSEFDFLRERKAHTALAALQQYGAPTMSFDDLMTDKIDLLKPNGERVSDLRASVQSNKVFMNAGKVLVEPNDLIVRRMSNGGEETYRVIDPCFYEEFHGIEAHYQMKVQKLGLPEARAAVQSITYNISGPNARVNNSSVDNSTNIVQVDARLLDYIEQLRSSITSSGLPPSEQSEALEIVEEVEAAVRSGAPKKSVVSALLRSLPHVANIATIASAIVGMLG